MGCRYIVTVNTKLEEEDSGNSKKLSIIQVPNCTKVNWLTNDTNDSHPNETHDNQNMIVVSYF